MWYYNTCRTNDGVVVEVRQYFSHNWRYSVFAHREVRSPVQSLDMSLWMCVGIYTGLLVADAFYDIGIDETHREPSHRQLSPASRKHARSSGIQTLILASILHRDTIHF